MPSSVDVVLVTCKYSVLGWFQTVYENVHAVVQTTKVAEKLRRNFRPAMSRMAGRKMSVLMIGIDSVSRLNFYRTMPLTAQYFKRRNWKEMRGYNKVGDNTFPNMMAFLTGLDEPTAFSRCIPETPYGLDNCPFIWKSFRDAGYVTAFGEDRIELNTFNYFRVITIFS